MVNNATVICDGMVNNATVICDHLRDVPWKDIFKLSTSIAASEFWCVQIGIDACIPQSTSLVYLWFSAACAAL